ncbi:hypothetical protein MKW92_030506 [Papaver armeniacum]|nr:hypothetical protein MKW92_030506 [Papaver armeniacum]
MLLISIYILVFFISLGFNFFVLVLFKHEMKIGFLLFFNHCSTNSVSVRFSFPANCSVASKGYGFGVFCTRAAAEEVLQTYNGSSIQNNL